MVERVEVRSRIVGRGAGKHRRGSGKAGVRGLAVWGLGLGLGLRDEGGTAGGITGWKTRRGRNGTGELKSKIKREDRILTKHNERKFNKQIWHSF